MKPIGALMWEHRLIEQVISLISDEIDKIEKHNEINSSFIDTVVDFFRMYADRTHHGKEEDILFRDLAGKKLSTDHSKIMDELVQEHIYARKTVRTLNEAKEKYLKGYANSIRDTTKCLKDLSHFYPKHIEKEDKHFFFPILAYFSDQEQKKMLDEFWEFDRKMIHEKYRNVVEHLRGKIIRL